MGRIGKTFALILTVTIVISCLTLLTVNPANAESIPKPSVPEFTLKYVDKSYNVPPTYGIDPYTGKNVMTQAGYYVKNASIEVIIKNQPFTAYHNENGSLVYLFYDIEAKGHFENWNPSSDASYWLKQNLSEEYPLSFIGFSSSQYTVETYGLGGDNATVPTYYGGYDYTLNNISVGGQVDFRVQAIIGYSTRYNDTFVPGVPVGDPTDPNPRHYVFTGEISDWSQTQTITLPASSVLPHPTTSPAQTSSTSPIMPTLTPTETSVSGNPSISFLQLTNTVALIVIAVLLAVIIVLLLLMSRRKTANLEQVDLFPRHK